MEMQVEVHGHGHQILSETATKNKMERELHYRKHHISNLNAISNYRENTVTL